MNTALPACPGPNSTCSANSPPAPVATFVADAAFVDRIRRELVATLAMVRAADSLPWPDLTQMTLAEMRFRSIARYLPDDEATELVAAFDAAMERIYEIENRKNGYI
ncbi:MAG TPA: hypothetical protein PKA13_25250 [Geminicoccaceae bacterium]|nr:hypothetical protein [Geminicoccaceae bacterium]